MEHSIGPKRESVHEEQISRFTLIIAINMPKAIFEILPRACLY